MAEDMNAEDQNSCDHSDPESVVLAFIAAMNRWEIACWEASRAAGDAYDMASAKKTMDDVFDVYCTPKPRPYGRQGSFQKPPEYDPKNEKIIGTSIKGRKSTVDTDRNAVLAGGKYRYTLFLKDGQWRIDNLKYDLGGRWLNNAL